MYEGVIFRIKQILYANQNIEVIAMDNLRKLAPKKMGSIIKVTKNIICLKSIFESESINHSLISSNPTAKIMLKIRIIFCKYRIPNKHIAKINAAGNLCIIFLYTSFTKTPLRV